MTDAGRLAILTLLTLAGAALYGFALWRKSRRRLNVPTVAAAILGMWCLVTGGLGLTMIGAVALTSRLVP